MSLLGPRLRTRSNEDRRSRAVRALEAGLEARWKAVKADMATSAGSRNGQNGKECKPQQPEVPAPLTPVPFPGDASDLQSKLADALEHVTVRSVVSLRGLTQVPRPVEAVVIAVLQLVSCDYAGVDLDPSPPPTTWDEARRVLLKPGHFVSSLRKFPFAVERGQISESDVAKASRAREEVLGDGAGLSEVHEGASKLYAWLKAALDFVASVSARKSPPTVAATVPTAYPRSASGSPEQSKPSEPYPVELGAGRPSVEAGRQIPRPAPKHMQQVQRRSPSLGLSQKSAGSITFPVAGGVNGWSKASTSSTASTLSTSPGSASARSAGVSTSLHGLNGASKPASTRSQRLSGAGASPTRRGSLSPTPVPPAASKQPSGISRPATSARLPASRSGQTLRTATSPQSRKEEAPRSREVAPLSSSTVSLGSSAGAAALPTPDDFAAMRNRLDQEKKEVRQIKSLESQIKWGLQREERRQTEEERREEARQIMEWRDREAKEMKDYVEEKNREQRVQELMQSKEYQTFKREWKQAMRKQEIERIKVQLAEGMDHAHWKVELQRAVELDRQLALQEMMEAQQEMREIREKERQREKNMQHQDRVHDMALEYAHQASQISSEKEELLRNLALLRQRQKVPVAGTATRAGTTFWPAAR